VTDPTIAAPRPLRVTLKRFFRAPKGMLILLLAILAITAAFGSGFALVAPVVLGGVLGAVIVDAPILRYREGEWIVPDGAILTGLIVAMVLSPMEPWYVAAITSAIAVLRTCSTPRRSRSSRRSTGSTPARAGGARSPRSRRSRW